MSDKIQIVLSASLDKVFAQQTIQKQLTNEIAPNLKLQIANVTLSPAAISNLKTRIQ